MKNIKSLSMLMLSASAVATINTASADIVHNDDVIITFSQCVGNDCVNGENFGFDTQRLKENNLRIHFDDTSNSASFPSNDWRIVVNDTGNGGGSYFAVEDSTAGRTPFRVDAGAPNDSLRVTNAGNVGIGVANPVVELHVKDGDSPTLRLEQDGSSGFTPQTYDIAANESNFFIRDVTNGSRLFFRAQPGAPADSMFIANDGDIGFGTNAPTDDLHIRDAGPARLALENSSATENPGIVGGTHQKWTINSNGTFRITGGSDATEFLMDSEGNLTILGSITTTGGTCGSGCDAVFESNHELPSIEEHAKLMWEKKHLPNVGPTIENQPINMSDKIGRMLNELETAHIYIEDLHSRIAKLEKALKSN
jgi:hypothetical protein